MPRLGRMLVIACMIAVLLWPASASAHNVSKRDDGFVKTTKGAAIAPFVYLGAKQVQSIW